MSTTFRRSLLIAATGLALCAMDARAFADYLLRIDCIEGESADARHKGYMEVQSFSWGVAQAASTGNSARVGKACPSDLNFSKYVDKSTPPPIGGAVGGTVIPSAVLIGLKSTGRDIPEEYLKIELKNVLVSSYQVSGASGGAASDAFSLRFGSMTVSYLPQKSDGSLGTPVVTTFQGGSC